jgi:hypothetical protein
LLDDCFARLHGNEEVGTISLLLIERMMGTIDVMKATTCEAAMRSKGVDELAFQSSNSTNEG